MTKNEREMAIFNLKLAVELAGDVYTDVEYELMYQLLDELSTND